MQRLPPGKIFFEKFTVPKIFHCALIKYFSENSRFSGATSYFNTLGTSSLPSVWFHYKLSNFHILMHAKHTRLPTHRLMYRFSRLPKQISENYFNTLIPRVNIAAEKTPPMSDTNFGHHSTFRAYSLS